MSFAQTSRVRLGTGNIIQPKIQPFFPQEA